MSENRPRTVLLIAFHYPPCATSSGLQRTLSFSIHLRDHGWRPMVLTVKPAAHERSSDQQLHDIPKDVIVKRTIALDIARHLSLRGRYWSRLALPDRWRTWSVTAIPAALKLIRQHNVDVIWSTYPIATAHKIGAAVAQASGVPWVADFRDPMVEIDPHTQDAYPSDPGLRGTRLRIEEQATQLAARLVFCTPSARDIVQHRYPSLAPDRLVVIPNGYEERVFSEVEREFTPADNATRKLLLHSGIVYPGADRDPTALFRAIRSLADAGEITPTNFELRLRGPSNEEYFRSLAQTERAAEFVNIAAPLAYREALMEMFGADGLLVLQGSTSNPAVPAKLYEYLRAGRPILPLVHSAGETARTLRALGIERMASLTDPSQIADLLRNWLRRSGACALNTASKEKVAAFSRERLSAQLAETLDTVLGLARR